MSIFNLFYFLHFTCCKTALEAIVLVSSFGYIIKQLRSARGGRRSRLYGNHRDPIQVCKQSCCEEWKRKRSNFNRFILRMWKFAVRVSKTHKQWRWNNKNIRQTSGRAQPAFTNFFVSLVRQGAGGAENQHKCFLTLRRAKRLKDERGKGQRVGSHSLQGIDGTKSKLMIVWFRQRENSQLHCNKKITLQLTSAEFHFDL